MSNAYPNGFRPNGDGPDGETWGRDPETGRAFTKNGTVRKARTAKSETDLLAEVAEREHKAQATIGRKVVESAPGMETFTAALSQAKAWDREVNRWADPDWVGAERARLEERLQRMEERHEVAIQAQAERSALDVDAAIAGVGAACIDYAKAHKGKAPTGEVLESIIAENIDPETRARVERAVNPDADPFADFRRNAPTPDGDGGEDDTL